jgi:hypothetical protein
MLGTDYPVMLHHIPKEGKPLSDKIFSDYKLCQFGASVQCFIHLLLLLMMETDVP